MRARWLVAPLALALAAGCGGDPAGDDGAHADANTGDASPGCGVNVTFSPEPAFAGEGSIVVATSTVQSRPPGVLSYQWSIVHDGAQVQPTPVDPDGIAVQFEARTAGIYDVQLWIGGGCEPFFGQLNVQQPGANTRAVRLRFVPPPSTAVPPQERVVTVTGGADYSVGLVVLDPGQAYPVAVRGPGGTPVQAYLRFVSRATPDAVVEGFSDATGAASVRLVPGLYDVLVVPSSAALAPRLLTAFDPLTAVIDVDAGAALTGVVRDGAGQPVAGARVSVTSGTVPSTVATTGADGSYSLRWRDDPAAAETLTVVPPASGPLPRIDAAVTATGHASLDVRYTTIATRDLAGVIVRAGGAPVASTEVVIRATVPAAAAVLDGATTVATPAGTYRRLVRTDAAGALPAVHVARVDGAIYAAHGPGAAAAVDLDGAASFALAEVAATGRVLTSGGAPLAGASVRAVLTGELAFPGAVAPTATTGADGRFTLPVAAAARYAVAVVDPRADDAALELVLAGSTTPVDLGDLRLRAAIALVGEVHRSGTSGGLRGVGVASLCHLDCTGIDRTRPLGSTVTDALGAFAVAVPDPGVGP